MQVAELKHLPRLHMRDLPGKDVRVDTDVMGPLLVARVDRRFDRRFRTGEFTKSARAAKDTHVRHHCATALALWHVCLKGYPTDSGVPDLRQPRAAAFANLGPYSDSKNSYRALTQDCLNAISHSPAARYRYRKAA
jgi:hypothetical protein